MLLTISVSASSKSPINPKLHVNKKSNLQVISVLKLELVYTSYFAIVLLHGLTLRLRNCFLVSLIDFPRIISIIIHMKVRMLDQSDRSTPQFLRFTVTIQLFSFKYIYNFLSFCANPNLYHKDRRRTIQKGRWPRTSDDLYLSLAGYSISQKSPFLTRSFTRSLHLVADNPSICRRN